MTEGIHRRIRHPVHLGFLIFSIGLALIIPNYVAGLILVIAMIITVASRLGREERMMVEAFGDEYEGYRKHSNYLLERRHRTPSRCAV